MVEDVVALTSALVNYDTSINPNEGIFPPAACSQYVQQVGRDLGYEVLDIGNVMWKKPPYEQQGIYPVVLFKRGKFPGSKVLFLGHLDVVPVPDTTLWQTDPFKAEVIDGKIFGRGASDMKSADASFITAFSGEVERGTVIIALSGDEEVGGAASMPSVLAKLREYDLLPNYVINGEPSNKPIIVTKRRGVGWYQLSFPAKKSKTHGQIQSREYRSQQGTGSDTLHSAQYIFGADIHAMFVAAKDSYEKLLISLKSSANKNNSVPMTVGMNYIEVGDSGEEHEYDSNLTQFMNLLAAFSSSDWPIVASKYGISVCPNLYKYEDSTHTFTFDIRAMFDKGGHEKLQKLFEEYFTIDGLQADLITGINPVNVDSQHVLAQTLARVAEANGLTILDIGEKLGGASDTRYFTDLGIPGVELGPGGGNEHGPNEFTYTSGLEDLVKIYRDVFTALVEL